MCRMILVALLLAALGCGSMRTDSSKRDLLIDVRVESDPGVALPGVSVALDGEHLGITDHHGFVRARRAAEPGDLLHFSYACPPGFVDEGRVTELRVRRYLRSSGTNRIALRSRCRPEARLAVFIVRARTAAPVDVHINGEWTTQTDAGGVAHVSRRAAPGSEFLVELRSRRANLRPTKVSRLFTLRDSHEIFVFDQQYRVRSTARRAGPSPPRIRRIE